MLSVTKTNIESDIDALVEAIRKAGNFSVSRSEQSLIDRAAQVASNPQALAAALGRGRGRDRATWEETYELCKVLLEAGADPNACFPKTSSPFSGMTPLMFTAVQQQLDIAELLTAKGADHKVVDENGRDAMSISIFHAADEIQHRYDCEFIDNGSQWAHFFFQLDPVYVKAKVDTNLLLEFHRAYSYHAVAYFLHADFDFDVEKILKIFRKVEAKYIDAVSTCSSCCPQDKSVAIAAGDLRKMSPLFRYCRSWLRKRGIVTDDDKIFAVHELPERAEFGRTI
jgi:hypothetical protein